MAKKKDQTRRKMLGNSAGALLGPWAIMFGTGIAPLSKKDKRKRDRDDDRKRDRNRDDDNDDLDDDDDDAANGDGNGVFNFTPFSVALPIPEIKQPLSVGNPPYTPGDVFHGIAPEYFDRTVAERPDLNYYEAFPTRFYEMRMRSAITEIIPGVQTPVYTYDGTFPGPTFRARVGEPCVVRIHNDLDVETSVHLHGGHNPSHADGYPNFYVLPGRARDYYYTNTVPMRNGVPDFSESPSTMWYHDHAMDIAAHNVWLGLAGFFITTDHIEQDLVDRNVLPQEQFDVPLVFQDRRFNQDGTLFFDPLDHDGTLGDVRIVNG